MSGYTFDEKTGNASVTCDHCGKPITHTNQWGMFCEDNCGLEASKRAEKEVKAFVDDFMKMFPTER